jgi:hypothetical protein
MIFMQFLLPLKSLLATEHLYFTIFLDLIIDQAILIFKLFVKYFFETVKIEKFDFHLTVKEQFT